MTDAADTISADLAVVTLDAAPALPQHQCDRMIMALDEAERTITAEGVPRCFWVYIVRNSNWYDGESDKLGCYHYNRSGAIESIEHVRGLDYQPPFPHTTFDCFVIDGRDIGKLRELLDEKYNGGFGVVEEYMRQQQHITESATAQ